MSIMVPIKDGEVVDTNTNSDSQEQRKAGGSLDKQAFLQLLVAQMKYQDPLEPTSNTEYVSQLATFSSLEQMQNLNATMQVQQGTNLVGKTVIMQVTQNGSNIMYREEWIMLCVKAVRRISRLTISSIPLKIWIK